ncbi:hypothetical protein ACPV5W_06250 [Vibrio astriarenae]
MNKLITLTALTLGLAAKAYADPIQHACEQNAAHAPSGVVESCTVHGHIKSQQQSLDSIEDSLNEVEHNLALLHDDISYAKKLEVERDVKEVQAAFAG